MSGLKIARGLELPLDAVTQTFAILARKGAGKTYTAAVMAEEMGAAGLPFVVLDPLGAWWGLRSSADGLRGGLTVVILGGQHGDVPLGEASGKVVADFVVDRPGAYILDLSDFESGAAQDRFVTDFADRLYRRKAQERSPLHLFVDEADSFAPQRPMPGQLKMLGAFENIVRRGRIRGLGATLITQRSASLNKNVLTQTECLVVLQTTGPQDRAAVDDWIKQNTGGEQRAEFLDSLTGLAVGEAWVWSPAWLRILRRVQVRKRKTFDSSRTPEHGERLEPKRMAPVDLDAVREALRAEVEKAEADDPRKLRARIAELQRELGKRPEAEVRVEERVVVEKVEVRDRRFDTAAIKVAHALAAGRDFVEAIEKVHEVLQAGPAETAAIASSVRELARASDPPPRDKPAAPPRHTPTAHHADPEDNGQGEVVLKAGARRMLDTLVRNHPIRLTEAQWATQAGLAKTGGTWGTYVSALRRGGYVDVDRDGPSLVFSASSAGIERSDAAPEGIGTDEVVERWRRILKAGARRILDELVAAHPGALSEEELAARIGMEYTGGTFGTYLSTLRRNGLAAKGPDGWRVTESVMGLS